MLKNDTDEESPDSMSADSLARAVGEAAKIQSHLEKNIEGQCGYCGQVFGPEEVVVEKEIYGRGWHFCDEKCYDDFMEKSNFKDQDLDGEPDDEVHIGDT